MIVPKPPTSTKVTVTGPLKKRLQVGCWGLLLVILAVFLGDKVVTSARLPESELVVGSAIASNNNNNGPAATNAIRNSRPVGVGGVGVRKRNAVFQHHAAFIRNTSRTAAAPLPPPPPPSRTSPSSRSSPLPSPLYSNFTITSNAEKSGSGTSRNISSNVTVTAGDKIGQALLDSSAYQIVGDNSICRTEECFETGMNIDKTESKNHTPPIPTKDTNNNQNSNYKVPIPNPTTRQQIADAILKSDFRNKRRESIMHPINVETIEHGGGFVPSRKHEPAEFWRHNALDALNKKLSQRPLERVAKNIIFFLGDGMSVPTVTAARILKGQQVDRVNFGEEGELHMDTFPYAGISKTFCSDAQVADSACTATAYFCGVKANSGTIGLTPDVLKNNCTAQNEPSYRLSSILAWAQAAGKSTGVVTTARVTHASPAGAYANIANRNWENDNEIKRDKINPDECDDIAEQLILREPGRNINVILGGGRLQFLPRSKTDPENGRKGFRSDGKNLIETWKQDKYNTKHAYVEGKQELLQVDTSEVDYLLGLFAPSHMEYFHEQEKRDDPTLADMTRVAIEILSKNPNGFFLFVEGARIDHAHHNNQGMRAIWETVEMDRALHQADEMTSDIDTLMIVTADHSHTFAIAGYPPRGNPISGIAEIAMDNMPYTTLSYVNGPAFKSMMNNKRYNISNDPLDDLKYKQIPNIPRKSETHGGDDVTVLTKGPFAHLFTGVQQQSYIPHALAYAACIGPGPKFCDREIHAFY